MFSKTGTKVKRNRGKIRGYKSRYSEAWSAFSKYIRKRSADWRGFTSCYTCGQQKEWKEMDAGHFKHGVLDFDEENIHPQCIRCNKFLHGALDKYAEKLIQEYGLEKFTELSRRAKEAKKGEFYTIDQLLEIEIKYRDLFNNL